MIATRLGDGSPIPSSLDENRRSVRGQRSKPFSVQFEIDIMQFILFVAALGTRMWQFDELHFGKFLSLYLQRIFFFDLHPPLGKMLLALAGGFSGFEGDISLDRIGAEYSANVPVYQLRFLPAMMGSFVVPLVYQIAVELGMSRWAAVLAGAFIVLDNAMLVQSRFMLMEGMLLFFQCLAVYSFLKFRNLSHREFSVQWWFWLCLTGVAFTCTLSIKYLGFFTALLLVVLAFKDFWHMLADITKSDFSLGGLAALTKGQPVHVAFGSQITLRHTHDTSPGKPCWLHSHLHLYPSGTRMVEGAVINNRSPVTHLKMETMVIDDPPKPVKHGDIIQLVHGITSRALNSHDVAAPLTPENQEVSCYIDYNVSMPTQNLWRVLTKKQKTRGLEKDQQTRDLAEAEMIPLAPTELSFWTKFKELQIKMFMSNSDIDMEHKYSSCPLDWPFATRNVAYWMNPKNNAQIHLLGNPVIWCCASLSIFLYIAVFCVYLMRRRRGMYLFSGEWQHFMFVGQLLVGGYLLHYLPYFLTDRTLFLHSYLPSVVYKVLVLAAILDHLYIVSFRVSYLPLFISYLCLAVFTAALWVFIQLSVFSYGNNGLSPEEIKNLMWKDSWDFLYPIK
ncbi:hypothetical protein KUTeg_022422, partial [Tegillarca granosa]